MKPFITITLFQWVPLFLLLDKDLLYAWGENILGVFAFIYLFILIILLTLLFKNTTKCL